MGKSTEKVQSHFLIIPAGCKLSCLKDLIVSVYWTDLHVRVTWFCGMVHNVLRSVVWSANQSSSIYFLWFAFCHEKSWDRSASKLRSLSPFQWPKGRPPWTPRQSCRCSQPFPPPHLQSRNLRNSTHLDCSLRCHRIRLETTRIEGVFFLKQYFSSAICHIRTCRVSWPMGETHTNIMQRLVEHLGFPFFSIRQDWSLVVHHSLLHWHWSHPNRSTNLWCLWSGTCQRWAWPRDWKVEVSTRRSHRPGTPASRACWGLPPQPVSAAGSIHCLTCAIFLHEYEKQTEILLVKAKVDLTPRGCSSRAHWIPNWTGWFFLRMKPIFDEWQWNMIDLNMSKLRELCCV